MAARAATAKAKGLTDVAERAGTAKAHLAAAKAHETAEGLHGNLMMGNPHIAEDGSQGSSEAHANSAMYHRRTSAKLSHKEAHPESQAEGSGKAKTDDGHDRFDAGPDDPVHANAPGRAAYLKKMKGKIQNSTGSRSVICNVVGITDNAKWSDAASEAAIQARRAGTTAQTSDQHAAAAELHTTAAQHHPTGSAAYRNHLNAAGAHQQACDSMGADAKQKEIPGYKPISGKSGPAKSKAARAASAQSQVGDGADGNAEKSAAYMNPKKKPKVSGRKVVASVK